MWSIFMTISDILVFDILIAIIHLLPIFECDWTEEIDSWSIRLLTVSVQEAELYIQIIYQESTWSDYSEQKTGSLTSDTNSLTAFNIELTFDLVF